MTNDQQRLFEELRDKLEDSPFVMLGLRLVAGHEEPMTAKFDARSYPRELYFFMSADNRVARGMSVEGPEAFATYVSKDHQLFATLRGRLTPCRDQSEFDRFWSSDVSAWFDGGRDDPKLALLRFEVDHVEIWKADVGALGKLRRAFGGHVEPADIRGEHVHASPSH